MFVFIVVIVVILGVRVFWLQFEGLHDTMIAVD